MRMQRMVKKAIGMGAAALIAVCTLVAGFPQSAEAATANQSVNDAKKGVLQVNLTYQGDDGSQTVIGYGSGFLINDEYVVTCAHVVNLDTEDLQVVAEYYGKSEKDIQSRLGYSVTISRDVAVGASMEVNSNEVDFSILKLEQSIQNRSPLTIRSSSSVEQTENVYAIGFPQESAIMQDINTYTTDDVTITEGQVNKVTTGTNLYSGKNTDYIQTSVKLTSGNSGGPMVDEEGYVIGVCEGSTGTEQSGDNYFYAIAIDQITEICDSLGIQYTSADSSSKPELIDSQEPEAKEGAESPQDSSAASASSTEKADKSILADLIAECDAVDSSEYTRESYSALTASLDAAKAINIKSDATQEEVDAAVQNLQAARKGLEAAKKGLSTTMIIVIAAAGALVVVIVILVVVMSSRKKKNKGNIPPQAAYGGRQGQPTGQMPGMSGQMRGGMSGQMPGASGQRKGGMSGQMPGASGQMGGMPGQMPGASGQMRGGMSGSMPGASGQMPGSMPGANQGGRPGQSGGFAPTPMTAMNEDGETTLLSGAGETTVLSHHVHGGRLVRSRNGESVEISKEEFIIGREQSRVDYCVRGNTSVGRVHAKIVVRAGVAYLVDLNATNGTFLNGVRCTPNREAPLKSGDRITFSDEEFSYQA